MRWFPKPGADPVLRQESKADRAAHAHLWAAADGGKVSRGEYMRKRARRGKPTVRARVEWWEEKRQLAIYVPEVIASANSLSPTQVAKRIAAMARRGVPPNAMEAIIKRETAKKRAVSRNAATAAFLSRGWKVEQGRVLGLREQLYRIGLVRIAPRQLDRGNVGTAFKPYEDGAFDVVAGYQYTTRGHVDWGGHDIDQMGASVNQISEGKLYGLLIIYELRDTT